MAEEYIGEVTHYFNRIGVAVIDLKGKIQVGDKIHILGYTTDFIQNIQSMQIEHEIVEQASPGEDVAMKVVERVRKQDKVYKTG